MDIKEFGKRLKVARLEKGMSQRSLGLALGLSDKTISSYESSRSYPTVELLFKISSLLEKPVEYFISSKKEVMIQDHLEKVMNIQEALSKEIVKLQKLSTKEE